jgi:hypothetical protein
MLSREKFSKEFQNRIFFSDSVAPDSPPEGWKAAVWSYPDSESGWGPFIDLIDLVGKGKRKVKV